MFFQTVDTFASTVRPENTKNGKLHKGAQASGSVSPGQPSGQQATASAPGMKR